MASVCQDIRGHKLDYNNGISGYKIVPLTKSDEKNVLRKFVADDVSWLMLRRNFFENILSWQKYMHFFNFIDVPSYGFRYEYFSTSQWQSPVKI